MANNITGQLGKAIIPNPDAPSSNDNASSILGEIEDSLLSLFSSILPIGHLDADGVASTGINGSGTFQGFSDPTGKYPLYTKEADTNRLASGTNLDNTVITKKEATRTVNVPIANGGIWEQAQVPYNATYPYNHVQQTESGHIFEFDDTPQAERIHLYHRTGTFFEIDANGTRVNKIVGDNYEIMERNGNVYVKGALNVTVDGAYNLKTNNALNIEVSGSAIINIYNDADINVSGNTNLSVGGDFNLRATNINIEADGEINMKSVGTTDIHSDLSTNIKSEKNVNIESVIDTNIKSTNNTNLYSIKSTNVKADELINLQSLKDFNLKTDLKLNIFAKDDINAKTDKNVNIQSKLSANIKSTTTTNIQSTLATNILAAAAVNITAGLTANLSASLATNVDGLVVNLGMGAAIASGANGAGGTGEALVAISAEVASPSGLQNPADERQPSPLSRMNPLEIATRGSEVGFDEPDSGDATQYASDRISSGKVSAEDIAQEKIALESSTGLTANSVSGATIGSNCEIFDNMSPGQFNPNMKLSEYFTIGDLTQGGIRMPKQNYTVKGVTYTPQQILCNLKGLCINVLDPIVKKYGRKSFIITSGFRRPPVGNQAGDLGLSRSTGKPIEEGGDHPTGCGVDLKFIGGNAKMFQIAKELVTLLPSWNQVILEYDGKNTWIHISFKYSGNKGDYFTMNHHKTYGGTYPKGGFILV